MGPGSPPLNFKVFPCYFVPPCRHQKFDSSLISLFNPDRPAEILCTIWYHLYDLKILKNINLVMLKHGCF